MPAFLNSSFSFAASGDNTALATVSGARIRIWRICIVNGVATAQSITIKDGASNALSGVMPLPTSVGGQLTFGDGNNPLWILGDGNGLVINLLNATNVAGFIHYTLG